MSEKFFEITRIIIESLPYIKKITKNELRIPKKLYNELINYKNEEEYNMIIEDLRLKYKLEKNYIIETL